MSEKSSFRSLRTNLNQTDTGSEKLDNIKKRLSKSEAGANLLGFLNENNYKINMVPMPFGSLGQCNPDNKQITLNSNMSEDCLIGILAHESRHAKQFVNDKNWSGGRINNTPETEIAIYYNEEADSDAYASLVCWQLKEKGDHGAWNALKEKTPEPAKALENAKKQGKSDNDALFQSFDAWFNDKTIMSGYSRGYVEYLDMLSFSSPESFNSSYSFKDSIPLKKILENICGCDGNNYFKGSLNNPKYQYMPKDDFEMLKNVLSGRFEPLDENAEKGMKTLEKNLKKIEQQNLNGAFINNAKTRQ